MDNDSPGGSSLIWDRFVFYSMHFVRKNGGNKNEQVNGQKQVN